MTNEIRMVEGFKNTEVGVIPNDWDTPCIKDFTDLLSGGTPSTRINEYWGGNIRWMNSGELNLKRIYEVEGRITELGLKNSATKLIPSNCVLIGLAGQGKTRGTVALNYTPLCTNQSIASILPNKEVLSEYIYQNLDLRYDELRGLSTGDGGRGGLNLTIIRNLQIPLPPTKAEQTAIATALNDADALITLLEKLIAKKKAMKKGAMQELLKPKEGWETKTLGEIVKSTQLGGNYANSESNTNYPLIKMGNIQRGFISTNKIEYIVGNCIPNERDRLKYGDVLFNTRNTLELVGKVSIWRDELPKAYFNSNLMRLEFNSRYISSNFFMNSIFNTRRIISKFKDIATGTTSVAAIYTRDLMKVEIIFPNREEQTRIAEILSNMDIEILKLEEKLKKQKQLKQGMMQSLLTGKIRLV